MKDTELANEPLLWLDGVPSPSQVRKFARFRAKLLEWSHKEWAKLENQGPGSS